MRRLFLGVIIILIATTAFTAIALAQPQPEFRLGFKALADQIPSIVGVPIEEEHWDAGGNSVQRTTTGLMVWRNSDRWTAFTDGSTTWILGPYGLQSRPNSQLYPWESVTPAPIAVPSQPAPMPVEVPAAPEPAPAPPAPTPAPQVVAPAPPPPPQPTAVPTPVPSRTYSPDVKAMDDQSGGHGVMVTTFIRSIDEEWARVWGWRPSQPVTIYLYINGQGLAYGLGQITGRALGPGDFELIAATNAVARGNDIQTGGKAILMNLSYQYGDDDWEPTIKALLLHEYAYIMQEDLAGGAGPEWFREGLAQWISYSKTTDTNAEQSVVDYAARLKQEGRLPTLMTLTDSWSQTLNTSGETAQAAYGASYLAVRHLTRQVGALPLLQALQRTAAGEDFNAALSGTTGFSIQRLESEYRNSIPSPRGSEE